MANLVQNIPSLFDSDECTELVAFSERCGFMTQRFGDSYPAELRHRVSLDDASIAKDIWSVLKFQMWELESFFNDESLEQAGSGLHEWSCHGINERIRFYKYHANERFSRHSDVAFDRNATERSLLSVIVYLNDDFDGGETTFDHYVAQPKTGSAIVFAHDLMHEGLPVTQGIKRVLRTDVMAQKRK